MIKPTLLVLAAGMGSRYGSLKQMDGVGPNNEAIIDYSVYDAIQAGFGKVVFVIRQSFKEDFISVFNAERFGNQIEIAYVYQELDSLPEGFSLPEGRTKPWGTNHAILMAKDEIDTPFATINADDFYGRDAFVVVSEYLQKVNPKESAYCMVAYLLNNTLSENGFVSRGICEADVQNHLVKMTERTHITQLNDGSIVYQDAEKVQYPLKPDSLTSMNMFGFTPLYFKASENLFYDFLQQNQKSLTSEYYIPFAVNELIESKQATMEVLRTKAQWYGVTYIEDRQIVVDYLKELHKQQLYPAKLWSYK